MGAAEGGCCTPGALCHVARREGAAEGGCCTPGALCHVARRDGRSRGRLLHSWGAFFGLVQRKRPRPRKENRLLPYPTTQQPHSRVPYPTGQNGHAFPRNPARQTLATWAYVAATMLCCSTFHARDVEDAAPYKAFARRSRLILTAQRSGTRSESADVDAKIPSDYGMTTF